MKVALSRSGASRGERLRPPYTRGLTGDSQDNICSDNLCPYKYIMPHTLSRRLQTERSFPPGERLMLALGLATADLGSISTEILGRHDLSHTQYNVLRMLRGAGDRGLSHSDITRRMVVGVPDVTRLVDGLEKRGLVRRGRDPADRRRVLHRIEAAGLRLLSRVDPQLREFHAWIEESMPEARRHTLVELCEEIIELAASRSGRELPR